MKTETLSETTIESILTDITFNEAGLVAVIAQQHDTGEVLMMAWMNRDAIRETLTTDRVCYWSRSRQQLWRKGESSGQVQTLVEFRWDCDGDTVLVMVDQKGVACHTGRRNCFFKGVRDDQIQVLAEPEIDPDTLYGR